MPPSQPIQAGSLSTVTKLADNPPLYVNPTAPVMPSLILYIVRVPGSQDLFLTTLHPLSTTVTAEDINACIYYIHIHPNSTGTDTANPPQPSHLAPRPTHHRRWSSQSLRSPRWHKATGTLPTMTIVRRDPASGAQWNVAKVSQLPPTPGNDDANSNDRIMLEITAEGYDKFLPPANPPFHPPPVFNRVMSLEGVGFWKRIKGIGHHRKSKSHDGNGSNGSSGEGEKAGSRKEKAKKRGYVFQGLWGAGADGGLGRCGFKDEAAGKFLKCKYYPPDINSAAQRSSLLSVIEFKPPSTTVMSSSSSGRHRTPSPSTDINSAAPESITSVKSKLGMLVLHSDGQYMMDLLIAANMAVFWRRWESWAAERSALGAR
ncbi:hypothetical protein DFP73DRAFT_480053 [Morchella snyderi]|nr:hypothetical protein DFP73DRAFT_480053 [Morchella snyderi]